jgi:hypothetical protein
MKLATKIIASIIALVTVSGCKEAATFYTNSLRSQSFVQPSNGSRYDFLWVLDNSGSMKPRRDYLRDRLNGFLSILNSRKVIDYQFAVVTTDAFKDQGALVKSNAGIEVVKSKSSLTPSKDFSEMVDSITDSQFSFWEQGLENSFLAITKNGNQFMRNGVPLVVVYLTDEDDFSCKEACWGVEPENNQDWKSYDIEKYITFFQELKKNEGSEAVLFPIIGTSVEKCSVPSLGLRYQTVAEEIGLYGQVGSICDSDLEESYNNIARIIADRGNVFKLDTPALAASIRVYVNKILINANSGIYSFDSSNNSIVFNKQLPSPGSQIEVLFEEK